MHVSLFVSAYGCEGVSVCISKGKYQISVCARVGLAQNDETCSK